MMITALVLAFVVASTANVVTEEPEAFRDCGRPYFPIINTSAPIRIVSQPWQVGIYETYNFKILICEGVLIDENFVLTAAKCVNRIRSSKLSVKLGDFNLAGHPNQERQVKRKIVHERFIELRPQEFINDIALLELERPVEYMGHIVPVCLPTTAVDSFGFTANVSGWGALEFGNPFKTPSTQQLSVVVQQNDVCDSWYKSSNSSRKTSQTALCGRVRESGRRGPCRNGAPMTLEEDGRAYVLGLSSGLRPGDCGQADNPMAFTNVAKYVNWIETSMKAEVDRDGDDLLRALPFIIFVSSLCFFIGLAAFLKRVRPDCLKD